MALKSGGHVYRSNVCNDIKSKLNGFVDGRTTPGAVLLKELLQNADDAGARRLDVLLDLRPAPEGATRLGGELAAPGLLVVNDGPFRDEHFQAIVEVASGNKLGDVAATGRFGVGFTSVYLAGDTCLLCSEGSIVVFDLLRRVIPSMRESLGKTSTDNLHDIWVINALDGAASWADDHDQVERLIRHCLALDASRNGAPPGAGIASLLGRPGAEQGRGIAAFRIPFRGEAGRGDELHSRRWAGQEQQERLLEEMVAAARESLVFLRSVESITLATITPAGDHQGRCSLSISPWSKAGRKFFEGLKSGAGCHECPAEERVTREDGREAGRYLVSMKVDFGLMADLRADNSSWKKCVPVGGVAVRLDGEGAAPRNEGQPWRVLLPLTEEGPSAALFHGGFFLDQARHSPIYRRGGAGETSWNCGIVDKLLLPMLEDLLRQASEPPDGLGTDGLAGFRHVPERLGTQPRDADSLANYLAARFHERATPELLRVTDIFGEDVWLPPPAVGPKTGRVVLQGLDARLERVRHLLPRRDADGSGPRWLSASVVEEIRRVFGAVTWCRAAGELPADVCESILRDDRLREIDTANQVITLLAGIFSEAHDPRKGPQSLEGLHLFTSGGKPVPCAGGYLYLRDAGKPDPAFREVVGELSLTFERVKTIDGSTGAADPAIRRRLGLEERVLDRTEETLFRLLTCVEPARNHHGAFAGRVAELAGKEAFWKLLVRAAKDGRARFDKLRLAWTVCAETRGACEELNAVVVVHGDGWGDAASASFWTDFLSEICPRMHRDLAPRHAEVLRWLAGSATTPSQAAAPSDQAGAAQRLDRPTEAFDDGRGPVHVVRTEPEEMMRWLGRLYWQGGVKGKKERVLHALTESIRILDGGQPGHGADTFLRACSQFSFFDYELELLYCLPIHRLASGGCVSLETPTEEIPLAALQHIIRGRFRLLPSREVPPPPGVRQEHQLLAPADDRVRHFYEETLRIEEHTVRHSVLDLLEVMASQVRPDRDRLLGQLRYLKSHFHAPQERALANDCDGAALDGALRAARLVRCEDGEVRRTEETRDGSALVGRLEQAGWAPADAKNLLQRLLGRLQLAAAPEDDERECLRVLGSLPAAWSVSDVQAAVLEARADGDTLDLPLRLRLLALFRDGLAPAQSPPSGVAQLPAPLLGGGECPFAAAELLPPRAFDLSEELLRAFFPNALDVPELAKRAELDKNGERDLRETLLPALGLAQLNRADAQERIELEFPDRFGDLPVAAKLDLLKPKGDDDRAARWAIDPDTLRHHGFAALEDEPATPETRAVHERLVELFLADRDARKLRITEVDLRHLVFECRDGRFHPGDACWWSDEITRDEELRAGAGLVIATKSEANGKLRKPLKTEAGDAGALDERCLELLFPATFDERPRPSREPLPPALLPWKDLLGELKRPGSSLAAKIRELGGHPDRLASLDVAEELTVRYPATGGAVVPARQWPGPPAAIDTGGKAPTLWVRGGAVPAPVAGDLGSFDEALARKIAVGLGFRVTDTKTYRAAREAIRTALERPEKELGDLARAAEEDVVTLYDHQRGDQEFSEMRRTWRGSTDQEKKKLRGPLLERAKEGMLALRREQMEQYGYRGESLFAELAQNAEDALAQRATLGLAPVPERGGELAFRWSKQALTVEHSGRPFNLWRHEGREQPEYREDVANLLGTTRSMKWRERDAATTVTGRFGVGFKCVYWFTDRPSIHSHVWHFEIEATCIPRIIEPPKDLPEGATRIVLPWRDEAAPVKPPSGWEVVALLLFTRELDAIRVAEKGAQPTVYRRREEKALGGAAVAPSRPGGVEVAVVAIDQGGTCCTRGLRLRRERLQLFLRLGEDGAPVALDAWHPDTFHTFPLSAQRHGLGVAVSAPFQLQSGRAHLAPAGEKENGKLFGQLGGLLAEAGDGLAACAAGHRPGAAAWWAAFWRAWRADGSADGPLADLRREAARGLLRLAEGRDVVPRWDAGLRRVSEAHPIVAFDEIIPEAFARELAEELAINPDRTVGVPATARQVMDGELAEQLGRLQKVAEAPCTARWLDWSDLAELFEGEGSAFGRRPALLNTLAEALWDGRAERWRDEAARQAAVQALRTAWLPTNKGDVRPISAIAREAFFQERGAPQYLLDGLVRLHTDVNETARRLLAGAGLKDELTWEEFRRFMDACPSKDDAGQLLAFLDQASFWRNWGLDKADELRTRPWVPCGGGRRPLSDQQCADLLEKLTPNFRAWLGIVNQVPVTDDTGPIKPPPPRPDPREVLEQICKWWKREKKQRTSEYESQLYGGPPPALDWEPGDDLKRRRAWVELFVLSMAQTLGWTTTEKQRGVTERMQSRGYLDVFADRTGNAAQWIGVLDDHLMGRDGAMDGFRHWIQLFWRIRAMAKPEHLDGFLRCLEDATKDGTGGHHPRDFLNPRNSPIGASRDDLPDGTRALGIGASFLWRELCRRGLLTHPEFNQYCFVPKASVRQLVERITSRPIGYTTGQSFEASREIYAILKSALGREETFGRCYDIPLLLLSEDRPLRQRVFGGIAWDLASSFRANEPKDPFADRDGFWAPPPPSSGSDTQFRTRRDGAVFPIN